MSPLQSGVVSSAAPVEDETTRPRWLPGAVVAAAAVVVVVVGVVGWRLAEGGTAWLVVQKNLGADSLQKWLGTALGAAFRVSRHTTDKGFRVLLVERRD